jgi:hypothetical protein
MSRVTWEAFPAGCSPLDKAGAQHTPVEVDLFGGTSRGRVLAMKKCERSQPVAPEVAGSVRNRPRRKDTSTKPMCRTSRNAVPGRQFLKVIEADQKAEAEAREADRVEQQAAQDTPGGPNGKPSRVKSHRRYPDIPMAHPQQPSSGPLLHDGPLRHS